MPESAPTSRSQQSGRHSAASSAPKSSQSWVHKGALALAVTGMIAAVTFPQAQSQASQDQLEAASNVTSALTASSTASLDFTPNGLKPQGVVGDDNEEKSSSVKPASSGSDDKASGSTSSGKDSDKDKAKQDRKKDEKSGSKHDSKSEDLGAPLAYLKPTSSFGYRVSPITGAASEFHSGQDYAATCGTPVKSSADGKVVQAGWHPYGGGNRVTVKHEDGLKTTYNHMSAIKVSDGASVKAGESVGNVGSTGASTGCHLHFEVVKDGQTVNPLGFL
ncbi:M23 family metallopeptidase [Arthrobacter sp. H14]|uniref:M23 family metallopeptidase n=1 Tax=Arthrobacter sp. H14 TaxID=1312959 RepID=UPI0004AE7F05|nr:M23 family metallopeptidase [Arthrobacter sp. H14]